MISPNFVKSHYYTLHSLFIDGTTEHVIFPTEWNCYGKFIPVTTIVSTNRVMGIPLIAVVHIVPVVKNFVIDSQIPFLSKRIL